MIRFLSGQPVYVYITLAASLLVLSVITVRVHQAARDKAHWFRFLLMNACDIVLLVRPDGQIIEANDSAVKAYGYSRQELAGMNIRDLVYGDGTAPEDYMRPEPERAPACEAIHRRRDGDAFPVEGSVNSSVIGGETVFLSIYRDVSERKQAEQALKRTNDELAAARKEAEASNLAKSRFLASMSHEIRTPINGIIGMTELTLDTELTAKQNEYLEMVRVSADSLLRIINNILDFSKIEAGKLHLEQIPFNIRASVCKTVTAMSTQAGRKGLELTWEICPDVPEVLVGDPHRIGQVLTNLVANAIKFTERGSIVVKAARFGTAGFNRCSLRFTVQDTGCGIPAAKMDKLFNRFSQTNDSAARENGGTGLGLAISKRIVEMMGGKIGAASQVQQGSAFYFTLNFPVVRQGSQDRTELPDWPDNAAKTAAATAKDDKGLVLVVEDDEINRKLMNLLLHNRGYRSVNALNGCEALEKLRNDDYALILMDIQLPEMDGFSATRAIRGGVTGEHNTGIPIIAVTAFAMEGDRQRCLEAGADSYIAKPVNQQELYAAMEKVLRKVG